ncbi:hypothetical protein JST97_25055 [bacterium]|nr:hypothetical protein [bacterium]
MQIQSRRSGWLSSKPRLTLQASYDRAVQRFGGIPGVQIEVCQSRGSGGQPVVVLRHQNGQNQRLHLHFHGDQLYDQEVKYEDEIGPCIQRAWEAHPDTVFVLPEAANESKAPRSDWNNISDLRQIGQDALAKLGIQSVQHWSVSGHSAGGSVVAKALARGSNAQNLKDFDRIELYDAAVSSTHNSVSDAEREKIKRWCQKNPEQFLVVPGVMKSSWLEYVDRSRWTEKASDHWSPLWQSLGRERQPLT